VCGLTRVADALAAARSGADWLGFIIHGESPRRIAPELAAEITAQLSGVSAVAVMVGVGPDQAYELARRAGAARIQVHRPRAPWPRDFPLPVAIVVPVGAGGELEGPLPDARHLLMLDTAHAKLAGGSGVTFPWERAREIARQRDVLLAGGLAPENVAEAVASVRPFGVDASSGLERSPGIKDPERIALFVAAIRAAELRHAGGGS
jgi:phosphoribosylanthranilate isomerase